MKWLYVIGIPLFVLLGGTVLLTVTRWDLTWLEPYYDPARGWLGNDWPWVGALYDWGVWPPISLALLGGVAGLVGLFWKRLRAARRPGWYLFFFAILFPAVVINFALKDYTGRPRPRDIDHFGGAAAYLRVGELGEPGEHKSFPSGHAGIAFFLMVPFFLLRHRYRWAWMILVLGLGYGALMGFVRMVVGGHYPTDVLWSGGLIYFGGLFFARLFGYPIWVSSETCAASGEASAGES